MISRYCPCCQTVKEEIYFYKSKYTSHGLDIYCKECKSIKNKPGSKRFQQSIFGIATHLRNKAKQRAKEKGLLFDLSRDFILKALENGVCQVTNIPFNTEIRRGAHFPSVDRIDSTRGYTEDNVQIVIWMYNAAKGTFTHRDVVNFAKAILQEKEWQ